MLFECCRNCEVRTAGCKCPEYLKEKEKQKAIKDYLERDKKLDHAIKSISYNRVRKR